MTISNAAKAARSFLAGLALACIAAVTPTVATAAEVSANIGTTQAIGQHTGISWGNVASESKGNAIAAAQVAGFGESSQWANTNTLGSSTIGSKIDNVGTTVFSGSTESATSNAGGKIAGNAAIMDGTSIVNGAAALGTTVGHGKVDGNFEVKQYGSFHADAVNVVVEFKGF